MAKLYRSREGEATAVDTKTQLTTLGSETAPGALTVPAGASTLLGAYIAAESSYAAAGSCTAFVRIEGPGLPEGPESIVVGAFGQSIGTGGESGQKAVYYPLGLKVTATNEIQLFGEMAGADTGQVSFGVTLVFE